MLASYEWIRSTFIIRFHNYATKGRRKELLCQKHSKSKPKCQSGQCA
jgi:hypothetical protein